MKPHKILLSYIFSILIIFFSAFLIFLTWNNSPTLLNRSNPSISKLNIEKKLLLNKDSLKVVSYNIHFGIGLNANSLKNDKTSFLKRLDNIANILKDINADVVLLQEVDFNSKRSHFIDQANYLAFKAGYSYLTKAPTQRKKVHIFYNNIIGKIRHGLCILSKYPIEYSEALIFNYSNQIPFFVKWLYDPHGALKCIINYKNKKVTFINTHLDPWDQKARVEELETINYYWLRYQKDPIIIGGDFNALSHSSKKNGYYLLDAPWFIDKESFDLKNDKTIPTIMNLGFKDTLPSKLSLHHQKNFTYPSNAPIEKLDYIFVGNKVRIIKSSIYKEAETASDHLPIVVTIKTKAH